MRQDASHNCIVVWNVKEDYEEDAFDTGTKSVAIFDSNGSSYIAEDDIITVCDQGVKLKSYQVANFKSSKHDRKSLT